MQESVLQDSRLVRARVDSFLRNAFCEPYLYGVFSLIMLSTRTMKDLDDFLGTITGIASFSVFRMAIYGASAVVMICYLLRIVLGRVERVNKTLICILAMFLYLAGITFVFKGASGYHMDWHAGFALMLMIDMGLQCERKSLIRGLTGAFEFWIYLNVFSFVIFPNSLIPNNHTHAWVLGNRAFYYRLAIPALALALLRYQVLGKTWKLRTILLAAGCLCCFVVQRGGTGIMGIALMLGMAIWCRKRALPRYMTPLVGTIAAALIFVGIYFVDVQNMFAFLIADVLGKSMTMSGRTEIWDIVVPAVMKNPITGIGYLPVAFMRSLLGRVSYSHTHNQLLELMLHGGVIAAGLYLTAVYFASREAVRYRRSAAVKTMTLLACAFVLMGVVEIFHNDPIYYALFIFLSRADCLTEDVKQLPRISVVKRIGRDLKKLKKA